MTINVHALTNILNIVCAVQEDIFCDIYMQHHHIRSLLTQNPIKGRPNLDKLHLFSESSISVSPSSSSASLASSASTSISVGLATMTLDLSYSMFNNVPRNTIDPTATANPKQPLQTINSSETGKLGVESHFTIYSLYISSINTIT